MTDHDVAVATPPNEMSEGRPERSLAEQLVERARADGNSLVGPGGLLSDLTKQVLETGLEVETEEHLGYSKHAPEGRNYGNSRNGPGRRRLSPTSARSSLMCHVIVAAASNLRRMPHPSPVSSH